MPEKSILLEKQIEIEKPDYSSKEEEYLGRLKEKMEQARDDRDQTHEEFDGMSYIDNYNLEEHVANTFIKPKRNKEDTNFQSGIVRQKLLALLAGVVNLNLSGDITAYDKDGLQIQALGNAMEDIILKTNEYDNDDEKKLLRQYELLKHGTVFVEELWDKKQKKVKKIKGKFTGKLNIAWTEKLEDAFAKPTRNIITGSNVYLGDITKYDISEQPFIYIIDEVPYQEAKAMFGKWDRWDNVPKTSARFNVNSNKWGTLFETQQDYIEIIRYQDKWNNEFALLLNGVLMTPIGLPLPWGYSEYNIAQQNLEPIHAKFAYGKSLVGKVKNKAALLDEMLRLGILKTQKSFVPPKFNLTGRVLSSRIFFPGKMNHGINPNQILNADDKEVQGVTAAEFNMIKEIQESINNETVSPTFQGQQSSGDPTATEIIELQRQAKMVLGLTVFSISMLEWKLEWLRLQNLLANWFQPEDTEVDDARGVLKNKYRLVSVERPIENEGMGKRMVIPTKERMSPRAIKAAEIGLTQEQGMPVRITFLDPDEVCSAKLTWQIVVRPKEKVTSEVQKLMFRSFMQDAQAFGPLLNMGYLSEKFATVWQEDPQKMFKTPDQMQVEKMQQVQQERPPAGGGVVSPNVKLPTAEKIMGQKINKEMQLA